jgi:hypothetical protein
MRAWIFSLSASRLWKTVGIFLLLACAETVATYARAPSLPASAPVPSVPANDKSVKPTAKSTPAATKNISKPYWNDLTAEQHEALAPLASEWNKLGSFSKEKWLELAKKFPSLSAPEQGRMHERMRDWVKLTPEQRRIARENYARVKKLPPEQRSAQWQQYQQLPEEKKKQLAATAPVKKAIVNPPLIHGKTAQSKLPAKPVPEKQPVPKQEGIQPSTPQPIPAKP